MAKLAFVLWVIGWPLACTISDYIAAKTRLITGLPHPTANDKSDGALVILVIWLVVALIIYTWNNK